MTLPGQSDTRRRELLRLSQGYWWGSLVGFVLGCIRGFNYGYRSRWKGPR